MRTRWYDGHQVRVIAVVAGIVFLAIHAVIAVGFRDTDYLWHVRLGEQFIAGEPFANFGDWYPLSRAMFDAVPALLPYRLGRAFFFFVSVASLGVTVLIWNRIADAGRQRNAASSFAAVGLSLAFVTPYLSRDFFECGLQLILLCLISLAGYCLWRGHDGAAGACVGLAVAYKFTPILLFAVLLWKGKWRAALAAVVVVASLNLLPAVHLGWERTFAAHSQWWARSQKISRVEDIAENSVEPPKVQNQSLMAALARYLQTYPEGHPLRLEHSAFVQFAALDRTTARWTAKGILLAMAAFIAWRMRGRWADSAGDVAPTWACACAFCAIISPLCWRQHLVLVWPAMFLVVRSLIDGDSVRRYWLVVAAIVLGIALPQRELFGPSWTLVMLSYRLDTFAVLACGLLALFLPPPPTTVTREVATPLRHAA